MRSVVIASEDSTFYQNDGFDWSEIHKSFDEDMAADRIIRGGSTITQQLAKNVFFKSKSNPSFMFLRLVTDWATLSQKSTAQVMWNLLRLQ